MENNKHQGPTTYIAPSEPIEICNGCKFLRISRANTPNELYHYGCLHTNFGKGYSKEAFTGHVIGINHPEICETPDWCPLSKKLNNIFL